MPAELDGHPLRAKYVATLNAAFEIYAQWIDRCRRGSRRAIRRRPAIRTRVYRAAIRAKALDTLRGLLPAATQSNVGMYGTGQAYEALLLRMRAHPLAEVRATADAMLAELRKVIPAFLTRVDQPDRGGRWSAYLADTRARTAELAARLDGRRAAARRPTKSRSTDFDPDGEVKVVAAALYAVVDAARRGAAGDRAAMTRGRARRRCCGAYVGERTNRRHKPGRAFERTSYRFDILTDYGAFRDLQRHRLLTIDWQALSARHGYIAAGGDRRGRRRRATGATSWSGRRELYEALSRRGLRGRRAVRRLDGVSRPLRDGHERARGDARDRAAHRAAGTSGVSARLPADAHADRRAWPATTRSPRRCGSPITRRSSSSGCRKSGGSNRSAMRAART